MLLGVVGPQRDIVSSWNAVMHCFELCSKELFLWFTFMLSLNVNSFCSTKNNLMAVVAYLSYFKLFVECVKWMYDSGLLVKIIGQTGGKAQRKIFMKWFPQRKQELSFSTKVDVLPSWREFVSSYQLVFSLAGRIC